LKVYEGTSLEVPYSLSHTVRHNFKKPTTDKAKSKIDSLTI